MFVKYFFVRPNVCLIYEASLKTTLFKWSSLRHNHHSHRQSYFITRRKITQSESQPRTARPRKAGCSSSATCSSAKKKPNKKIQTKSGKVCSRPVPPAIEDLLAGAVGLMSCCHIAVIYMPLPIINQLYYISKPWARCHSQLSRSHCSCTSLSS